MEGNNRYVIIFMLICIFVIFAIISTMYFIVIKRLVRKHRCTDLVIGTIRDITKNRRTRGKYMISLDVPICQYTYQYKTYCEKLDYAIINDDLKKGDMIEFYVNPNKPQEISKLGKVENSEMKNCVIRDLFVCIVLSFYAYMAFTQSNFTNSDKNTSQQEELYSNYSDISNDDYQNIDDIQNVDETQLEDAILRTEAGINIYLSEEFEYEGTVELQGKEAHSYTNNSNFDFLYVTLENRNCTKEQLQCLMDDITNQYASVKFEKEIEYNGITYYICKREGNDAFWAVSSNGRKTVILSYFCVSTKNEKLFYDMLNSMQY